MSEYLIPGEYGEAEYIEKRSRFIGRVWYCAAEAEALEHIKQTQKLHWDATHNVYAYIIKNGPTRFSDDGEPSGTSGLPTLDVFRKGGVSSVCCVVTRYFGGILLGGGGLVRAYGHTASLALEAAGLREMRRLAVMTALCPYSLYERVRGEAERMGSVDGTEFGAEVLLRALLPTALAESYAARVTDLTNGLVRPEQTAEVEKAVKI